MTPEKPLNKHHEYLPDALKRVHCHVCPLKEFCSVAEAEGSYRMYHYDRYDERYRYYDNPPPNRVDPATPEMEQKVARATAFCPIREMIKLV